MNAENRRVFLLRCARWAGVIAGLLRVGPVGAKTALVTRVRVASTDTNTRVVFDLTAPVSHTVFSLQGPDRVVVDIDQANLFALPDPPPLAGSLLHDIRYGATGEKLRVVLDVASSVEPSTFSLPPSKTLGHRLVIDLRKRLGTKARPPARPAEHQKPAKLRDFVVAIDPGHGGKDPGAVGRRGTREKDIVLSIARRLEALIKAEPGMRPVMTRARDVYIPLRGRILKARQHKADVFLSIHADAARNRNARGSSVYVLSSRGATSEHARWLAKQENEVDLVGGVSLDHRDEDVASVLLDLSQTATLDASIDLAGSILSQLKRVGRIRSERVEQAGFVVLKSPDIPSVLIETAFISNAQEELRLRKSAHQRALAAAILNGLKGYLREHAPPGTRLAAAGEGAGRAIR